MIQKVDLLFLEQKQDSEAVVNIEKVPKIPDSQDSYERC